MLMFFSRKIRESMTFYCMFFGEPSGLPHAQPHPFLTVSSFNFGIRVKLPSCFM